VTDDQTAPTQPPDNRPTRWQTLARHAVLILPLILVNGAAIYGQVSWAETNLTSGNLAGAILFATTLESIAIYLAYEAHSSLIAGDASGRLRLASYLAAAVVGSLNYSHFAGEDLQPTTPAIAFGMLSALSPWLWGIRSRSMRRDQLRTLGLIDPRAARFATAKWALYPIRTFRAFRWAVAAGEQRERVAWEAIYQPGRPTLDPTPARPAKRPTDARQTAIPASTQHDPTPAHNGTAPNFTSKTDAMRHAFEAVGSYDVPAALAWLRAHGVEMNRSFGYEIRKKLQTEADQRPALVAVGSNGQTR
jgi:hypothetical protein